MTQLCHASCSAPIGALAGACGWQSCRPGAGPAPPPAACGAPHVHRAVCAQLRHLPLQLTLLSQFTTACLGWRQCSRTACLGLKNMNHVGLLHTDITVAESLTNYNCSHEESKLVSTFGVVLQNDYAAVSGADTVFHFTSQVTMTCRLATGVLNECWLIKRGSGFYTWCADCDFCLSLQSSRWRTARTSVDLAGDLRR